MASFVSFDEQGGLDMDISKSLEIFDEEITQICVNGLNKAAPILKRSVEETLSSHGELSKHVKAYKAKKASNGVIIAGATFKGEVKSGWLKDKKMAASTAAFWLEYGTEKQPARPWMDKSVNKVESEVLDCIQEAHDEAVTKLGLSL